MEQEKSNMATTDSTDTTSAAESSASKQQRLLSNGYDFTHFESYFAEHRKMKQEEELYVLRKRGMKQHRNSCSKEECVEGSQGGLEDEPDISSFVAGKA